MAKTRFTKAEIDEFDICEDNFGFDFDKFVSLIPWQWYRYVFNDCDKEIAETGRWVGKTFIKVLVIWFCFLNFSNYNAEILRKDKSTHIGTTFNTFQKVWSLLSTKGICVDPDSKKVDESKGFNHTVKEGKSWMQIKHPKNKTVLNFDSIGKFSDSQLGREYMGVVSNIWVDELSAPSENSTGDSDEEIQNNIDILNESIMRTQTKLYDKPIKKWFVDAPMIDENGKYIESKTGKEFVIHVDGVKVTKKFKTEKLYFYRNSKITFTLNAWDPDNFVHDKYYEEIWEATKDIRNLRTNQNMIYKYHQENNSIDSEKVLIIRCNAWVAKDSGYLQKRTEKILMQYKTENRSRYETVCNGEILESSNLTKFIYKESFKSIKEYQLEKCTAISKENERAVIQLLRFGLDWGFSKSKSKKAVCTLTGFGNLKPAEKLWKTSVVISEWKELSKSNYVESEQLKLNNVAKFIYEWFEYFKFNLLRVPILFYDNNDKVAASAINKILIEKFNTRIIFKAGAKQSSQGWGIEERIQFFNQLFSSGNIWFNWNNNRLLIKEILQMTKAKNSQKRDPYKINDALTALEYSFTDMRYYVSKL